MDILSLPFKCRMTTNKIPTPIWQIQLCKWNNYRFNLWLPRNDGWHNFQIPIKDNISWKWNTEKNFSAYDYEGFPKASSFPNSLVEGWDKNKNKKLIHTRFKKNEERVETWGRQTLRMSPTFSGLCSSCMKSICSVLPKCRSYIWREGIMPHLTSFRALPHQNMIQIISV